jgi:hypothetical protein
MSQDDLHQVAQVDTPNHVEIPNTPHGLILWLLGRFGVAVVFAASTFYVYQDLRSDRAELLRSYERNMEINMGVKNAIENMNEEIKDLARRQ